MLITYPTQVTCTVLWLHFYSHVTVKDLLRAVKMTPCLPIRSIDGAQPSLRHQAGEKSPLSVGCLLERALKWSCLLQHNFPFIYIVWSACASSHMAWLPWKQSGERHFRSREDTQWVFEWKVRKPQAPSALHTLPVLYCFGHLCVIKRLQASTIGLFNV